MKSRQRGFTLIEILVVISILGVLMGLVSILVLRAGSHKEKFQTEQVVRSILPTAIERFKTFDNRYPPMDIKGLTRIRRFKGLTLSNDTNMCNEVLLVALRHPDLTSPLGDGDLPTDTPFGDTDQDSWNTTPDGSSEATGFEILDAWKNPIIYINKNHYKTPVRIVLDNGEEIEVYAAKKAEGQYYNPSSYQLISLGENAKQDAEMGSYGDPELVDDILNFTLEKNIE